MTRVGALEAFVFVQTKHGHSADVLERVRSLEGVIDAQMVTGPYDVIPRVRLADLQDLDALLATRVRTLERLLRTLASPIVSDQVACW